jgi:putative hemolysin
MDDPEPDPNTIIFILLYVVSTLVCMLVTMGTSALRDVSEKKIHDMADDGDKTAKTLSKLIDRRPKPADTHGMYTVLCTMFAAWSALFWFLPQYAKHGIALSGYANLNEWLLTVVLPALVILLSAGAVFSVIGVILPRRIGKQNADSVAFKMAGLLVFFKILLFPVTVITSNVARILIKIFGGDPHIDEAPVTEDEILSILDEGEETGVLEEIEKEMINNIFEFGDLTAGEVMTHRTYLTAVETTDDLSEVIAKAIDAGCSRIPVYEDELDNIKGVLYVKDLLKYIGTEIPQDLKPSDLMREAMFIPESKKCRELFTEMTEKHLQMVIVSDEYGGVAGIVTVEDLIESIVGNIQDEFDDEDEEIEQIDEDVFNIDGISAIADVEELLDIEFPEGEYDTVAGYVMSVLGRIPDADEHPTIEYEGFSFTVEEMDERRIVRILVERLPEPTEGDEAETSED